MQVVIKQIKLNFRSIVNHLQLQSPANTWHMHAMSSNSESVQCSESDVLFDQCWIHRDAWCCALLIDSAFRAPPICTSYTACLSTTEALNNIFIIVLNLPSHPPAIIHSVASYYIETRSKNQPIGWIIKTSIARCTHYNCEHITQQEYILRSRLYPHALQNHKRNNQTSQPECRLKKSRNHMHQK